MSTIKCSLVMTAMVLSCGLAQAANCGGKGEPACNSGAHQTAQHNESMRNSPSYRANHNYEQAQRARENRSLGQQSTSPAAAQNNSDRGRGSKQ